MKIINEFPPNYAEIKQVLNPPKDAVFAYGYTIYNPGGYTIPEDIIFHEKVHADQQKDFGTIELWWTKYLTDSRFRQGQEVEAYALQYQFLKNYLPNKAMKEVLCEFAERLVGLYGLTMSHSQAETYLRKYATKT